MLDRPNVLATKPMTFEELGLNIRVVEKLKARGILSPTPIQAESFPKIMAGQSVLGLSKTGSGKTLAYLAPLLELEQKDSTRKELVLLPTRELAQQVQAFLEDLLPEGENCVVIVGGEAEDRQIEKAATARWILATPGRLLDLLQRRKIQLGQMKGLIFDEADRLLDMGFIDDIRALMKFFPSSPQMLFFSATLHFGVEEMAYEFGVEVDKIGFEQDELTVEGLDHRVAFVGEDEKFFAVVNFLSKQKEKRGIIFSNYRDKAHDISDGMRRLGYPVEALSAQLSQPQRSKIMEGFRAGKLQVIVASDLAARGLDVHDLDFVINYDLPEDAATYVHRVGRTARAGKKGIALSYVGFQDSFRLEKIEKFLQKAIPRESVAVEELSGVLPRHPSSPAAPRRQERPQTQPRDQSPRSSGGYQGSAPRHPQGVRPPSAVRPSSTAPRAPQPMLTPAVKAGGFWTQLWMKFSSLWRPTLAKAPTKAPANAVAPAPQQKSSGHRHDEGRNSGDRRPRGGGRGRGPRSPRSPSGRRST